MFWAIAIAAVPFYLYRLLHLDSPVRCNSPPMLFVGQDQLCDPSALPWQQPLPSVEVGLLVGCSGWVHLLSTCHRKPESGPQSVPCTMSTNFVRSANKGKPRLQMARKKKKSFHCIPSYNTLVSSFRWHSTFDYWQLLLVHFPLPPSSAQK